jgi:hypothetical protein
MTETERRIKMQNASDDSGRTELTGTFTSEARPEKKRKSHASRAAE